MSALKWKLILGFVLVFVAGGMTGAFIAASHARHHFGGHGSHSDMAERMRHRLRSELDLTAEQEKKIAPILDRTADEVEAIRKETGDRVHNTMKAAHEQMASALSPEQRVKLEQVHRERLDRHARGRGHKRRHHGEPLPP